MSNKPDKIDYLLAKHRLDRASIGRPDSCGWLNTLIILGCLIVFILISVVLVSVVMATVVTGSG